ncbi:MAG: hypothetical protein U0Q15_11650 [Kineosporiaceae bacterium]
MQADDVHADAPRPAHPTGDRFFAVLTGLGAMTSLLGAVLGFLGRGGVSPWWGGVLLVMFLLQTSCAVALLIRRQPNWSAFAACSVLSLAGLELDRLVRGLPPRMPTFALPSVALVWGLLRWRSLRRRQPSVPEN